jgi:hypothetical protein
MNGIPAEFRVSRYGVISPVEPPKLRLKSV